MHCGCCCGCAARRPQDATGLGSDRLIGLQGQISAAHICSCAHVFPRSEEAPFWTHIPDTLLIKISTQNFQGNFLGGKIRSPMTSGITMSSKTPLRNLQYAHSGPLNVCQGPSFLAHIPDKLPIKLSTQNFHCIFLWVK